MKPKGGTGKTGGAAGAESAGFARAARLAAAVVLFLAGVVLYLLKK